MKKIVFAAIVVLAAGLGAWLWLKRPEPAPLEKESQAAPASLSAKVKTGDLRVLVEASGRVVPEREVEIKCKASGEVIELPVDVSDAVKKGDLLIQLDPVDEERSVRMAEYSLSVSRAKLEQARLSLKIAKSDLETERVRAKAALKSAEAKFAEAKAKLERTLQLEARKMASAEELDSAKTDRDQAEESLEVAKASIRDLDTELVRIESSGHDVKIAEAQAKGDEIELEDARQRLEDTRVASPIDGVVVERDVQVGQIIASGVSNVGGGTSVMSLADLSRIYILVSVDESDIGRIRTGQRARITVDAHPDLTFHGEVVRVATKGANTSNVVTFEVKVEVKGANAELLKPEMTANVEIVAADKTGVLLVPITAVRQRRGERFVEVVKGDGATEQRPVVAGMNDGEMIEIESGLEEGENVLADSGGHGDRWKKSGDDARNKAREERMRMRMMRGGPH